MQVGLAGLTRSQIAYLLRCKALESFCLATRFVAIFIISHAIVKRLFVASAAARPNGRFRLA